MRKDSALASYRVPERGTSPVGLLSPCHPATAPRALIDVDDSLVLLCVSCMSPFLVLSGWDLQRRASGEEGRS